MGTQEDKMSEEQAHSPNTATSFEEGAASLQEQRQQQAKANKAAVDAVTAARVDAEKESFLGKLGALANSIFGPIKDKLSNFSDPIMKQVEEIQSYMDVQAMLLTVVPPIRVMMSNAFGDKIIGPQKILTEAQAMMKQVQMDVNNMMTMVDDAKALPAQMNALANETIGEVYAAAGLAGGTLKDFSNLANGLQNDYTLSSIQDFIKNTPGASVGQSGSGSGVTNKDLFIDIVGLSLIHI